MYPVYHITEEKGAKFGRGTTTSTNKKVLKKKKTKKFLNDLMVFIEKVKG